MTGVLIEKGTWPDTHREEDRVKREADTGNGPTSQGRPSEQSLRETRKEAEGAHLDDTMTPNSWLRPERVSPRC